ncbi:MAG: D-glycerate dehydrogenase [Candidatus Ryanbacteria bacterium RIFCSPHIGHO2_02_FULL_48_12]|uniref:D-glycerate dehydrogenase n=1 Tax=Candidatus Ryanbacteria bacterium RIFCSPHIGHO2_01_FULL_48_27 TaxID=1802115 RepID=A0A1G2G6D8_9BACT|nr:MAG: D-glycerate dehydrogenase [Candidatus Ryanbacteria bacterium RIFCSPHIGHO2_01_FULL_48_27]OGZ49401.1 MAG: D-glycerate dehydrogenase [Candidatus Ryanbacteria bacterium RIFCSPHIGHO2_02_FULL_48_12]
MSKIFVTRRIPEAGIKKLTDAGHEVVVNPEDRVLAKDELIAALSSGRYDAVLCLLTDKIDGEVFASAGAQCKIFANYAVGFDNVDLPAAKEHNMMITNTPGVLTETVAEHAVTLMLAIAHRVAEADKFIRAGKYHGWAPMLLLGADLAGKTVGILGLGRIGSRVAHHVGHGFDCKVIYYDVKRNEDFEKEFNAEFRANAEDVLKEADFVSVHVPLLDSTRHLINAERLAMMKRSAFLINTSRGPVVDEAALVEALKNGVIRGAGLDVFEHEPDLASGLSELENVVLTPHLASATEETRSKMAELAADNIIAGLSGAVPPNLVK